MVWDYEASDAQTRVWPSWAVTGPMFGQAPKKLCNQRSNYRKYPNILCSGLGWPFCVQLQGHMRLSSCQACSPCLQVGL